MSIHDPAQPKKGRETAIDWEAVRSRLASAEAALERAGAPGAQEADRILKARAQALARPCERVANADGLEVIEFLLAEERYAIETRFVREVHALETLTPLPGTPAFVLGIINLRGEILSVIDVKKFFDLPEKGLTDLNKVLVLHAQAMWFGILADRILGAGRIAKSDLQPSLPTLTGVRDRYLKGVTAERTIVLDGAKLLADGGIVVRDQP